MTASVAQFVVHELVGHGSACLLLGGRIVAVAPLWMRCSVDHRLMVLAGPMANLVAGGSPYLSAARRRRHLGDRLPVRRSLGWLLGGAAAAVGFIALVGPAMGS